MLEARCTSRRVAGIGNLEKRVVVPWHFTEDCSLRWYQLRELIENHAPTGVRDGTGGIAGDSHDLSTRLRTVDVEASDEERHVDEIVIIRRRKSLWAGLCHARRDTP